LKTINLTKRRGPEVVQVIRMLGVSGLVTRLGKEPCRAKKRKTWRSREGVKKTKNIYAVERGARVENEKQSKKRGEGSGIAAERRNTRIKKIGKAQERRIGEGGTCGNIRD